MSKNVAKVIFLRLKSANYYSIWALLRQIQLFVLGTFRNVGVSLTWHTPFRRSHENVTLLYDDTYGPFRLFERRNPMKRWLSDNEAVAYGVWEADVGVVTGYPGTKILEAFARFSHVCAERSPNVKVALDVAIGSAYASIWAWR